MADEHKPKSVEAHDDHHSDTVTLFRGIQVTIMGGIYTVVFIGLGILTALEVGLFSLGGTWVIPVMLALAVAKATLVVLYYMHLKTDSRIFAITLLFPLGVALISVLYLLTIPTTY